MADKYKEYLAARVLAESKPVTYRLLSRTLTVHVNIAKQMLHDFYTTQNSKKPNSLHATYLLTGRKRTTESTSIAAQDGEDTVMQSSPYMSSMPEPESQQSAEAPVQKTSIVLVKEEQLEPTKAEFEKITSIHIYSLEPGPLESLNVLSVCNQEIVKTYSKDEPLERWRLYGSAQNPYIKRRTTKHAPPTASTTKPAPKPALKAAAPAVAKPKEEPVTTTKKANASHESSGRSTPQPTSTSHKTETKSSLQREKSDIFKSFAKTKTKPKGKTKSKDPTPAPAEDEPMQGMSEDEGGEDDIPAVKFDEEKAAQARKARDERSEKLRKMMEESDEEMADIAPEEEEPDAPLDAAPAKQEAEPEPVVTSQGGRRRGRRKVMKKKKVKDDEGYLVTIEEAVWESFSEDEPEPKKLKPTPKPASTAKKGGKMGQGSIASFFKKA